MWLINYRKQNLLPHQVLMKSSLSEYLSDFVENFHKQQIFRKLVTVLSGLESAWNWNPKWPIDIILNEYKQPVIGLPNYIYNELCKEQINEEWTVTEKKYKEKEKCR